MAEPTDIELMERFVGLCADDGRVLYATLTREQQAALDARGIKSIWRSMTASGQSQRRKQEAWAKAIEDAKAKAGERDQGSRPTRTVGFSIKGGAMTIDRAKTGRHR